MLLAEARGLAASALYGSRKGITIPGSTPQLSEENKGKGFLLGCQIRPRGDMVVEVPIESQIRPGEKIATGAKKEELHRLFMELAGEVGQGQKRYV